MSAGPHAYVTYFDHRYLAFAIVMLRSVRRHDPDAEIFALCFDQIAFDVIDGLGDRNIIAIPLDAVHAFEPALATKTSPVRKAFYAVHKPVLPLYVLSLRPRLAAISHIDADCYLFSSPAPLFAEIGQASIAISPHRFSPAQQGSRIYGEFNAGFIYWRNDALGLRCLTDYRDDCFEWCEPRCEPDGRFFNQGYLTQWPQRYPGVHVIRHAGVNLSFWNVETHRLAPGTVVTVDGLPLIFYHFSYLSLDTLGIWRTFVEFGDSADLVMDAIYRPYLEDVERTDRWLRQRAPDLSLTARSDPLTKTRPVRAGPWPRSARGWLKRIKWSLDPQRHQRAD